MNSCVSCSPFPPRPRDKTAPLPLFINEFAVESDVEVPGDTAASSPRCIPDCDRIVFRRASLAAVPSLLRKLRRQLVYDVGDGFLIEPPSGVAVHIDFKGRVITLDAPDDKLPVAVAWAVHAGLGAATITHGGLPLHGAGLEINGRRIGLMADSGAGKSTLSWHLLEHGGARFANDDLIPVRLTETSVTAFPAVSLYPKLGREAVDRHNLSVCDLLPADYGTGEEEYYVPLPQEKRVLEPAPLSALFLLRPAVGASPEAAANTARTGEITTRRLDTKEAAATLEQNLHAVWLIGKWMDGRRLRAQCQALAGRVPVYELGYARSFAVLPALAETIRRQVGRVP